jgi:hypothetical protein
MAGTGATLSLRGRGRAHPWLGGRPLVLGALGLGALVVVLVAGVAAGSVVVPPGDTLAILAHRLFGLDLGSRVKHLTNFRCVCGYLMIQLDLDTLPYGR